jgi:uncharacterized protein YciI
MRMVCAATLVAFAAGFYIVAQDAPAKQTSEGPVRQYVVVLKRGPKWAPNKRAAEQPLLSHGRYLNEQMAKGTLRLAGPFLDDSGGLIVYNGRDEADVRAIAERDPGLRDQILEIDFIRPFEIAFDAVTGKTPFQSAK